MNRARALHEGINTNGGTSPRLPPTHSPPPVVFFWPTNRIFVMQENVLSINKREPDPEREKCEKREAKVKKNRRRSYLNWRCSRCARRHLKGRLFRDEQELSTAAEIDVARAGASVICTSLHPVMSSPRPQSDAPPRTFDAWGVRTGPGVGECRSQRRLQQGGVCVGGRCVWCVCVGGVGVWGGCVCGRWGGCLLVGA